MDINVTLAEIRQLATTVDTTNDPAEREFAALGLAAAFTALDEWIMRNGFLPMDWHRAQRTMLAGVPTAQG